MTDITIGQYSLVYNAFSFTIAMMGAATIFFFLGRSQVSRDYKTAVTITGLVTLIAGYHYFRIFGSWEAAYTVTGTTVKPSGGMAFNDAYRYVDWLLTVPLLMAELVLVMRLPAAETWKKDTRLGILAALMIILGYPGEVASSFGTRWLFWVLAMIPFLIIVSDLFIGLRESIAKQPDNVRGLVNAARWLTVLSWAFYPIVFVFPMIGFTGGGAETAVQVGYTIADIVSKVGLGMLVYVISVRKSEMEMQSAGTASPMLAAE
jgi:bacteriorhodopsin